MNTRTELINSLIKERGYTAYLEIGVQAGVNFHNVICQHKIGVDPVMRLKHGFEGTSDEYFDTRPDAEIAPQLVFIDGLHHAEQVEKDILNSMKILHPNGCILVHDVLPPDEASQRVPRETKQWWGDVWRAAYGFMQKYKGWTLHRFDCGILQIEKQPIEAGFTDYDTTFEEFKSKHI